MEQRAAALGEQLQQRQLRIEPATLEDLPALAVLLTELLEQQPDFTPDQVVQERGLALILENPARGRVMVIRNDEVVIGMVNLLFTISTALGGFVILMEDVIIHPKHRGQGYGSLLLEHVVLFATKKNFKRITLLTDKMSDGSQRFFQRHLFDYSGLIPMRRVITE